MHYKQIMKAYPDAKVGPSFVNHLLTWCVFLPIGCVVRERSKDMVHLRLHIHLPNWFSSKVICLKNMNMRKCKNIMFFVRTSLGEAPNCKVACWTGHKFQIYAGWTPFMDTDYCCPKHIKEKPIMGKEQGKLPLDLLRHVAAQVTHLKGCSHCVVEPHTYH